LPGEKSIYVDEQEKNGRTIAPTLLDNPNNRFEIIDGEIKVPVSHKQKIEFLDKCNRNADSPCRNPSSRTPPTFRRYTEDGNAAEMLKKQELQAQAIEAAKNATDEQIVAHVKALGIRMEDSDGVDRSEAAILLDYRQIAMDTPDVFMKSFPALIEEDDSK
jgi:hypothetical protein